MVPFLMWSSYCLPVRLSVMLSVSRLVRGASSAASDGAGFTGFIVGTLRGGASAEPQCTPTAPPAGRVSARQLLAPVDGHSLHRTGWPRWPGTGNRRNCNHLKAAASNAGKRPNDPASQTL